MVDKTLPTLTATLSIASDTLFIVRRNGQTEDEKVEAQYVLDLFETAPSIVGGTLDNAVIGGTTPAAGTFTTLSADTVNTGNGAVECFAMNQAVQTTDDVTFNSVTLTTDLSVSNGGTGASTASAARTNLGVAIGSDVLAYDDGVQSIAGLTTSANKGIYTTASDTYATYDLSAGGRALANAAGTANTFPYFSASNTVSLASITTAGRALLDDADASSQRVTMGVEIGVDVQAQDNRLQALADVTGAGADKMVYFTSGTAMASTSLTSFARTLLDDANSTAARSTLGLGTMSTQEANSVAITGGSITGITDLAIADGGTGSSTASGARSNLGCGSIATQDSNNVSITGGTITGIADIAITDGGTGASTASGARTNLGLAIGSDVQAYDADTVKSDVKTGFTKQQNFGTSTLTDGATINWNLDNEQTAKVTLAGNRTMAAPTNMVDGGTYTLRIIQDATGSRTLTWNSVFKWPGGVAPTISSGANDVDVLTFVSDGTNMYGVAQTDFS